MYIERKIHSGFVASLLFVAAFLILVFYVWPTQKTMQDLSAKISQIQDEVQKHTQAAAGGNVSGALSEVDMKELDQAIPEQLQQDIIISNISSNAKQADVAFNALTFSLQTTAATSGQGGQAVPTVTVSASFQGPSENIMRFLQLIENNPRKMVVKDAGVSTADSIGGAQPLVNLNLTLQAFYRNNVQ